MMTVYWRNGICSFLVIVLLSEQTTSGDHKETLRPKKTTILKGWPEDKSKVFPLVSIYNSVREMNLVSMMD